MYYTVAISNMNTILRVRSILCQPKCDAGVTGKWCFGSLLSTRYTEQEAVRVRETYSTLEQTEKG